MKDRYYRVSFRVENAVRDFIDRHIRGLCCAAPSGLPGSPGYNFWRCSLKRGHTGSHRTVNYLWSDPATGRPEDTVFVSQSVYAPRDNATRMLDRKPCMTRRQRLVSEAWHAQNDRERRAAAGLS